MKINGLTSSLSGLTRQSAAMDRAAEKIARATAPAATQSPLSGSGVDSVDVPELLDGTVEMMVAKRMFTAAVKMAQTANEGVMEALRVGGYGAAA